MMNKKTLKKLVEKYVEARENLRKDLEKNDYEFLDDFYRKRDTAAIQLADYVAKETEKPKEEGSEIISSERKNELLRCLLNEYMEGATEDGLEIVKDIFTEEELAFYGWNLSETDESDFCF